MEDCFHSYQKDRKERSSTVFATALTVAVNLAIVLLCSFNGLKYIYPPPEEKTMLIEFDSQEELLAVNRKEGIEPQAEEVRPDENVEMVQRSEAPLEAEGENLSKEATPGGDGDVEIPKPEQEEEIDTRALFHAAPNIDNDTLAVQKAAEATDNIKAGHADGNASKAHLDGMPNARLKGRTVVGLPVKPTYTVQNSGTVVVEIRVDRQGSVSQAIPGAAGTTVTDPALWKAARIAAMKTKFNVDPEAEGLQTGTITYIFSLE